MKPLTKRQLRIATAYAGVGSVLLVGAFFIGNFPPLTTWLFFLGAFVALEYRAVEVNDRMMLTPGLMVLFTAATVFALNPDSSAVLGMTTMAAIGAVLPSDVRARRWFQPLANFGQLVAAAFAAGLILDLMLADLSRVRGQNLLVIAVAGSVASLAYTVIQLTATRFAVHTVYGVGNLVPWSGTHQVLGSQVLMGSVGGLLGAGVVIANRSAVMPLILVVYVIAYSSVASYSRLRQAHESALKGFVKALEARDLYTRGHTERVAYFARLIGQQLRFTGTQLERLRWAALIHDLGKLAIPTEFFARQGRLTDEEFAQLKSVTAKVDSILSEVEFLKPMVAISGVHYLTPEDIGGGLSLEASILATADTFESKTATRSHRMPMNQDEAFAWLRADKTGRFRPEVVDALETALGRTGERYGESVEVDIEEPRIGAWR